MLSPTISQFSLLWVQVSYPYRTRTRKKCTSHDQTDALGVYVINLGVQKRAFNRQEALKERGVYFHFWNPKTNDERLLTVEYPVNQLIHLGRSRDSEIHIRYFDVRILAQARCVVIVSLSLLIH